ncbi:transposase [Desulfosporosinus acidiphilus SJ4]|uniref:Transposase n=1 Tax=Desulfosporosinus acidiphilus (strain DSM 22704 / JCM 16185 / SJ4) TaxID=646529 RepID=I4D6V9_DESAJ|nr:helix-turn-helix domain-containing protein [Desulfosporosinus acidiphilus]AFM41533.1 transposase [Desulfosporosinus acidiphilus SJ4]
MSHRSRVSGSEKIAAIEKYLRGEDTLSHLASLLGVDFKSAQQWLQTYHSLGPNGLINTSKNTAYSVELRTSAVKDYLVGGGSYMDICRKYGIKSTCQLRYWCLL